MSQTNRCLVCNAPALYPSKFCSQECEDEYYQLMEEIDDNLNQSDEEE